MTPDPISPARIAAFHALRAVTEQRADLPAALARARGHLSDERDRALAAEIVTGALRWQRKLDHLIEHFAQRPLEKIDPDVRCILRLSLYQLLHLDRVPASAVVDEAVKLTQHARRGSAAGFVNAVLRSTLRQRHRLPLPPRPDTGADRSAVLAYLGITYSHPDWLVSRWFDRLGFDAAEQWVRFNNDTPRLTIRANTLRATREAVAASLAGAGVDTEPARHAPDGLTVTAGNPLRLAQNGSFFVQDEASQLVSVVAGAQPGERVLDLCASPGGKTVAMAADMNDRGLVVACDVREKRVRLLHDTVRSSGAGCIRLTRVSTSGPLPFRPVFDRVLVDAPCSGLGTIRRDPDIRWRRHEADLAVLAADQRALLQRAASVVRPGGRLIYATCSSEPEENEMVVDAFLSGHPAFTSVDLRTEVPQRLRHLIDDRGRLHTLPSAHALEAFFAAVVVRSS
jgi:16S rRNA (cytosine967-C5)-methyltransferase